jgi:hypothetical protein
MSVFCQIGESSVNAKLKENACTYKIVGYSDLPGIQSHSFQNRGVIMNKFASMQAMLVM